MDQPPDCPETRKEMQEIAARRRQLGYRRIGVLLERKGKTVIQGKLHQIYCEEGRSVKPRRGRKRAPRSATHPIPWP